MSENAAREAATGEAARGPGTSMETTRARVRAEKTRPLRVIVLAALWMCAFLLPASPTVAQPPCGGQGQPVCSRFVCDETRTRLGISYCASGHYEATCNSGLQNVAGVCLPCGGNGQPICLSGAACNPGFTNVAGTCQPVPCGGAGQIVCASGPGCRSRLNAVGPPGGGVCAPCGGSGQPACASGASCDPGLSSVGGVCAPVPCGGAGQIICATGAGCQNRLNAVGLPGAGVCAPCGRNALPACASGPACDAGFNNVAGFCLPPLPDGGPRGPNASLFAGIFRPTAGPAGAWVGQEWTDFLSQWQAFEQQGLRIVDFETYVEGDRRLYAGIFKPGTYNSPAWIGREWTDFLVKWQEFERQGFRIIDFETWSDGGRRLYGGIFAPGTYRSPAWVGLEWADFLPKWQELDRQGFRIFDLEVYSDKGRRLYAGIFRPGTYNSPAWVWQEWASFLPKWQETERRGFRVFDLEVNNDGGRRFYSGIFEPSSENRPAWVGFEWENFSSKWRALELAGYQLSDLEVYEGACPTSCSNQVIRRCPDKPDCRYDYSSIPDTARHCEGVPGTCPTPTADSKVTYRSPFDGTTDKRLRHSALDARDQIFTLPFKDEPTMTHNGWLYKPGEWHHAVDYVKNPASTFKVLAAAPGRVIFIGWDTWSGNTIVVSHDAGGVRDAYRTIYMHLRNGAARDCEAAWSQSVPTLNNDDDDDNLDNYTRHLEATRCTKDPAKRNPLSANWGTNEAIDTSLLGRSVSAGQFLAWAGETGPGGNRALFPPVNTHLHIFFAHRDPTAPAGQQWYLFDPYGIYGTPDCYPPGMTDSLNIPCARYPVAWKGGRPQFP